VPPLALVKQVVATAFVGRDQTHMNLPGVRERTIEVDTSGVGITDFRLSPDERADLLEQGRAAAAAFLAVIGRRTDEPGQR
jgi:NTE family protein